jgi:hypothetical protein
VTFLDDEEFAAIGREFSQKGLRDHGIRATGDGECRTYLPGRGEREGGAARMVACTIPTAAGGRSTIDVGVSPRGNVVFSIWDLP